VQVTILPAYAGGIEIGQRKLFLGSGTGPASYSNVASSGGTGDIITMPFGFYIDFPFVCMTKSGNFMLIAFPSAVGTSRATWAFKWFQVSNFTEVANTTNLSAESVQFPVLGGDF